MDPGLDLESTDFMRLRTAGVSPWPVLEAADAVVSQQLPTQQDVRSSQWLFLQVSQWFPAVALN